MGDGYGTSTPTGEHRAWDTRRRRSSGARRVDPERAAGDHRQGRGPRRRGDLSRPRRSRSGAAREAGDRRPSEGSEPQVSVPAQATAVGLSSPRSASLPRTFRVAWADQPDPRIGRGKNLPLRCGDRVEGSPPLHGGLTTRGPCRAGRRAMSKGGRVVGGPRSSSDQAAGPTCRVKRCGPTCTETNCEPAVGRIRQEVRGRAG